MKSWKFTEHRIWWFDVARRTAREICWQKSHAFLTSAFFEKLRFRHPLAGASTLQAASKLNAPFLVTGTPFRPTGRQKRVFTISPDWCGRGQRKLLAYSFTKHLQRIKWFSISSVMHSMHAYLNNTWEFLYKCEVIFFFTNFCLFTYG